MKNNIKSPKGAVSVLVIITVLTFSTILLGAFLTITTLRKSQIRSDIRIQEIYSKDLDKIDEIYEEIYKKEIDILPEGYTRVEYIQGTGTQYTVIDNLSTTDFGFDIEMSATTGTGANVFGGFKQGNSTFCYMGTRNNKISYFPNESKVDFVATTDYENKHDYKLIKDQDNEFKYYYDGNLVGTSSLVNNADSTIGVFTFVDNNGVARTSASEVFRGKIYKFIIYDGQNMVCNLIPCIKNSNSKPGFYDTVNNKFYSSTGTNEFEIPQYTIIYNLDEGVVTPTNPTTVNAGTQTFTLNNPTKDKYTFVGWTRTDNNASEQERTNPQMTVTIEKGDLQNREYTANYVEGITITRAKQEITSSNISNYIGTKIIDYNPTGDQDQSGNAKGTWRVFYLDTTNKYQDGSNTIFIIRNNITISDLYEKNSYATNLTWFANYNQEWNTKDGIIDNVNEQICAYLCNPNEWTKYLDSNVAKHAIASPSLELYADAYNQWKGVPSSQTSPINYIYDDNAYGYSVGASGTYNSYRYYTTANSVEAGPNSIFILSNSYILLASPNRYDNTSIMYVDGKTNLLSATSMVKIVCPIVSLK